MIGKPRWGGRKPSVLPPLRGLNIVGRVARGFRLPLTRLRSPTPCTLRRWRGLSVGAYANTAIADIGIIGSEELSVMVTIFSITYPHGEQSVYISD